MTLTSSIGLPNVLQRKLHDPRRLSRSNLPEGVVVQGERVPDCDCPSRYRPTHACWNEAVGDVKGLGPDLESLRFVNVECSGQCHIELPCRRADQTIPANVAVSPERRCRKCGR